MAGAVADPRPPPLPSLPPSGRRGDGSGAAVPVALAVLGTARPGERGDGAAAAAGHVSGAMGPGGSGGTGERSQHRPAALPLSVWGRVPGSYAVPRLGAHCGATRRQRKFSWGHL